MLYFYLFFLFILVYYYQHNELQNIKNLEQHTLVLQLRIPGEAQLVTLLWFSQGQNIDLISLGFLTVDSKRQSALCSFSYYQTSIYLNCRAEVLIFLLAFWVSLNCVSWFHSLLHCPFHVQISEGMSTDCFSHF